MGKKAMFKIYDQNRLKLIPPSFDELIPVNHPVRVVNDIIDHINLEALEKSYKGSGASSHHPRMLLKVLIYAYLRNLYSSRKIEEALHESVHFMWISAGSKPDHNTLNDFRGKPLSGYLKEIFIRVVLLLNQQGHLCLKQVYVEVTKIQANANGYSFVWGKSIQASRRAYSTAAQGAVEVR